MRDLERDERTRGERDLDRGECDLERVDRRDVFLDVRVLDSERWRLEVVFKRMILDSEASTREAAVAVAAAFDAAGATLSPALLTLLPLLLLLLLQLPPPPPPPPPPPFVVF